MRYRKRRSRFRGRRSFVRRRGRAGKSRRTRPLRIGYRF